MEKVIDKIYEFDRFVMNITDFFAENQEKVYLWGGHLIRFTLLLFVFGVVLFGSELEFTAIDWFALIVSTIVLAVMMFLTGLVGMAQGHLLSKSSPTGYRQARNFSYAGMAIELLLIFAALNVGEMFSPEKANWGYMHLMIHSGGSFSAFHLSKLSGSLRYGSGSTKIMFAQEEMKIIEMNTNRGVLELQATRQRLEAEKTLSSYENHNAVLIDGKWVEKQKFMSRVSSASARCETAVMDNKAEDFSKNEALLLNYFDLANSKSWDVTHYQKKLNDQRKKIQLLRKA